MDNFERYQKYSNEEDLQEALKRLDLENIKYRTNDLSFSINDLSPGTKKIDIELYLGKADFDKADKLLIDNSAGQYYLYDFNDQELIDVVVNEHEWSEFDTKLAKQVLNERGKQINEELLHSIKAQRMFDLSKTEESQKGWIWTGYIFAILGGLISIAIGYHLKTYQKQLPDGSKVYAFNESDRRHGNNIFILGIILGFITLIFRIIYEFNSNLR